MTYAELYRDIRLWTSNTDPEFLGSVPRFIRQAESRIGTMVRLPAYNLTTGIATTASGAVTSVATVPGFISVDFIQFPLYGILEQKSPGFIKEAYPDPTEIGPLRYFAMQDAQTIVWGPTPDKAYQGVMQCFAKWPSLVDLGASQTTAGQSTFISANFETALLHACMYYASLFMKDPEMAAIHKAEMQDSLGQLSGVKQKEITTQQAEKGNAAIDESL